MRFLYLITNMMSEMNFQSDNNGVIKPNKMNYEKTPCSIHDENMVCGADLNFYPNTCVAKRNGITHYKPKSHAKLS